MKISHDCLISPLLLIKSMSRVQESTKCAVKMPRYKYWLLFCCFFVSMQLVAQQVQKFTGRVTDSMGAVLSHATVVAHNLDTGVDVSTKTTNTGDYTIPYVIPGHYSVSVHVPGFETAVHSGIVLQIDQASTVNFVMKVGSASETVTVNADTLLDVAKADNGEVVENTRVTELPINGRDPGMLAILSAGALWTNSLLYQAPFQDTAEYLSVNGGGTGNVALMMDGVANTASPINNNGGSRISYTPPVDSVQEFKIVTNPYDAQYGLMAGAVEDVTLKTGTNKLHGDTYEYARRTWLDANTWQNDWFIKTATAGTDLSSYKTPQNKWDQYGVELNGPVRIPKFYDGRNKSFFAVGFENFHQTQPNTIVDSVPSTNWKNGDFSDLVYWDGSSYSPIVLYDPQSIQQNASGSWVRQPFEGNIIPSSRINTVSQNVLKLFPAPNTTPAAGSNPFASNYVKTGKDEIHYRNLLAKWDQEWSANDRFSLSYGYWNRVEVRDGNGLSSGAAQGWYPYGERSHTFTLNETHTFTPTLLLDFRANVGVRADFAYYSPNFDPTTLFGWTSAQAQAMGPAAATTFPYLNFSEFTTMGTTSNGQNVKNSLSMFPTVTWIKGTHTIHAGIDLRFWQISYDVIGGGNSFYIDRSWTQKNCSSCGSWEQQDGNSIASFLLGNPTSGSDTINVKTFWSAHYYAPFIQDDWKATRKLTLNLGVRWDWLPAEVERHNQADYAFNTTDVNPISNQVSVPGFSQLLGGPTFLGVNGNPRGPYATTKLNIQLRVGIAYALNDKTVLRAGFGESKRSPQNSPNSAGYSSSTTYVASDPDYPDGVRPNLSNQINNPYASIVQPAGNSQGMETQLGQGPWFMNPHYKIPSFWNYSAGFERQLSSHDVINISYVGTRLYNGDSSDNINRESASAIEAQNCNPDKGGTWENCNNYNVSNPFQGISAFEGSSYYSASTINGLNYSRPMPEWGDVTEYQLNDYRTWYNSLQVVATHKLNDGLVLHGTWAWSKMMDAGGWQDQTYRVRYRAIDDSDRAHRITVSGVYQLPVGRGHSVLPNLNRIMDSAIGGWQLGGLYVFQTGAPLKVTMYSIHNGYSKPHIQKNNGYIRLLNSCVKQWEENSGVYTMTNLKYDSDSTCSQGADFESIESYMPSVNPVYQGRLLRSQQFDFNLSKNFLLAYGLRMQVRMEAFNALNHPLWTQGPDTTPNDSSFGTITRGPSGQSNQPRQMQLSAKITW